MERQILEIFFRNEVLKASFHWRNAKTIGDPIGAVKSLYTQRNAFWLDGKLCVDAAEQDAPPFVSTFNEWLKGVNAENKYRKFAFTCAIVRLNASHLS